MLCCLQLVCSSNYSERYSMYLSHTHIACCYDEMFNATLLGYLSYTYQMELQEVHHQM